MEEVGRSGDKDVKPVLHFEEIDKELTVNKTNAKRLTTITASDDTDNWPGKKVVVYWDPDIEFGGELTGGVRVRAMKTQAESLPF